MNSDDLDAPWFVLEEADVALPDVTWHRICHEAEFGPTEIAALQSFQDYPHTHRRRCTKPCRNFSICWKNTNHSGSCEIIATWLPMP